MKYLKNLSITISSFPLLLFCLLFSTTSNSESSDYTLTLASDSRKSSVDSTSDNTLILASDSPKSSVDSTSDDTLTLASDSSKSSVDSTSDDTLTLASDSPEFSVDLPSDITIKAGDVVELTPEINEKNTATVTYEWLQTSGSPVSLTTNNGAYLQFTAPENDNLTFEVIATNSDGYQDTDTINVTVLPADVLHSATITWTAPALNTDGSELQNLAGYKIYYGQSATQLDMTILVNKPELTSFDIANLSAGKSYVFRITAFNSAGFESQKSDTIELIL